MEKLYIYRDVEPDNSIQLQFDEQEEIKFLNAKNYQQKKKLKK
jgi:two-component system response regulator YesN